MSSADGPTSFSSWSRRRCIGKSASCLSCPRLCVEMQSRIAVRSKRYCTSVQLPEAVSWSWVSSGSACLSSPSEDLPIDALNAQLDGHPVVDQHLLAKTVGP